MIRQLSPVASALVTLLTSAAPSTATAALPGETIWKEASGHDR